MSRILPLLSDPILARNPITVQILGLCSALAITQAMLPALIMSTAVIVVLSFSNVMISLLRHHLPTHLRLILEMTIIASAVIVVDEAIKTFAPEVSRVLSVFVGLIITNCILLGRAENFALHHAVIPSLADGVGNGLGYAVIIMSIAMVRELFGQGSLFGYVVFSSVRQGGAFEPLQFLSLPASAFFLVALLIWWTSKNVPPTRGAEP